MRVTIQDILGTSEYSGTLLYLGVLIIGRRLRKAECVDMDPTIRE